MLETDTCSHLPSWENDGEEGQLSREEGIHKEDFHSDEVKVRPGNRERRPWRAESSGNMAHVYGEKLDLDSEIA